MAKKTIIADEVLDAVRTLVKSGFKVTLYKEIDALHSIERVYTPKAVLGLVHYQEHKTAESERNLERGW